MLSLRELWRDEWMFLKIVCARVVQKQKRNSSEWLWLFILKVTVKIKEKYGGKASQKVFTVHGHDEAAKHAVARFIERLGLEAIILDEQSGGLQAIIDKFEEQAEDIVLLSFC